MRNLMLLAGLLLCSTVSYGQWVYKTVDNGFDAPYKIAYSGSKGFIKMENVDGAVSFYIVAGYTCEDNPTVDISFTTPSGVKVYTVTGTTSSNNEVVFLIDDMTALPGFVEDFKAATLVKIRINESFCDTDIYEFKMSGSTAAYNFMSKP
jgi:hypothetical protein